jgi:hypothetical protein
MHHSIPALEESANNGCRLYTMILDKLPENYMGHEAMSPHLWELLRQKSLRLQGAAVIRPRHLENDRQDLCLELSYSLDGASGSSNAYLFTVDLDLHPLQGTDIHFDLWI